MTQTTPNNIEAFNQVVAITLVKLYEAFPVKLSLDPDKIGEEAAKHFGLGRGQWDKIILETAPGSIEVLIDEGFIVCNGAMRTYGRSHFPDARLTLKGLKLLGDVPESVAEGADRQSFADQLKSVVEDGAKQSATDIVTKLFGYAISIGFNAAASL